MHLRVADKKYVLFQGRGQHDEDWCASARYRRKFSHRFIFRNLQKFYNPPPRRLAINAETKFQYSG